MSSFEVKEGKFLGHMVTEEGLRADPERIQAIILSPTPRSPNQIRSLFLQLTAINKSIPKLAELKHPLHEVRTRMETSKEAGWTNEAEEALRRIKRKLGKLQTLAIPKEGETLIKEAEGLVMKKFFGQGEQVEGTPNINEEGTFTLSKKLKVKSTPTPRAWRLYVGKETIEEGLAACINQGMKDLHDFIDSLTLVAQVEGSQTSVTEIANHKVEISQSGSIGGYQNKTSGGRDKQQQERKSSKQCAKGVKQKVKRGLLFIKKEGKEAATENYHMTRCKENIWTKNTRLGGHDEVRSHHQNSGEAGISKDISGDEGPSSGGTTLNSTFITAERGESGDEMVSSDSIMAAAALYSPDHHGTDTHSSIPQAYVTGQPDVQHNGIITGIEFRFNEKLMGGATLDTTGVPLPEETLTAAKQFNVVLLGGVGGSVIT
ncbi:reverse transcriptase domain-containing protein [Tanacetum coccineum]